MTAANTDRSLGSAGALPRWPGAKQAPATAGDARDVGRPPGQEDLPEEEMATHPVILAWTISWTEEPGGLPSMSSGRIGHE